jgi:hypothetical protein
MRSITLPPKQPFWTVTVQRLHQSRAVLPKPPHEPVSAKLAYLKLRLLTPLRDSGHHYAELFRCSTLALREVFRSPVRPGTTTKHFGHLGHSCPIPSDTDGATIKPFWIPQLRETTLCRTIFDCLTIHQSPVTSHQSPVTSHQSHSFHFGHPSRSFWTPLLQSIFV